MVLAFLAAPLVVAAAVDAPISAVTVYSDRARVTRSVELRVSGTERVELPVLPERADVSTVRVDVQGEGASVERIDVEQVLPEAIPADEARKLLAEIEALDARTSLVEQQLQAWRTQSNTLMQLVPTVPEEALRPAPRLDSSGWAATMSFVSDRLARSQARARELESTQQSLHRDRARLVEKARLLGGASREGGWRVVPTVRGDGGAVTVQMTYFVGPARWVPTYDLQLAPERGEVQVSFAGLVSQESGEDWSNAKLVLSTAVPATATEMPKLASWKLGERERFIPTPTPKYAAIRPPPPAPPLPREVEEEELLRQRLYAVAGGAPTVGARMPPQRDLPRPQARAQA
ncbi:MAG: mucoidy inhibitor MuiA family protein, partial [Myxococcaceae bacterium]